MKQQDIHGRALAVPPQRARATGPSRHLAPNVHAVTPAPPLVTYRCGHCGDLHTHCWRGEGCYSALCLDPPGPYQYLVLREPTLFDEPMKLTTKRRRR